MVVTVVCLWKWGHHWQEPGPRLRRSIVESLKLFGIYPETVQVCSNCARVLLASCTCIDGSVKTIIMRPFPPDACEFCGVCKGFDPKSDTCTKYGGGGLTFGDVSLCGTWQELKELQDRERGEA